MPLRRLLLVLLASFPLSVVAQNEKVPTSAPAPSPSLVVKLLAIPSQPGNAHLFDPLAAASSPDPLREQLHILNSAGGPLTSLSGPEYPRHEFIFTPGGQLVSDTTCFAIRSYVVARDSKDSDSTHLVHYSTCQPASRYRLRTTQLQTESTSH